jgi:DNA-binding PadR family transcriptional regulator
MEHQRLLVGFMRLHVLHHAAEEPLYGGWMIEELRRHGYRISPGTLYPLLHVLERDGYLASENGEREGRPVRLYRTTKLGKKALKLARERIKELFYELVQDK